MTQTFVDGIIDFFRPIATTKQVVQKPPVVKAVKPKKEVIYKANVKACEEYLLRRQVEKGMHNLTTKF